MLLRRSVQLVVGLLFLALAVSCGGNSVEDVPLIFASASLSDVLTESAAIYERETGRRVEFSFGGSLALANQIAKLGAPADGVFFVGEEPKMILDNLVNPKSRRLVLSGSRTLPRVPTSTKFNTFWIFGK